MGRRAAPSFPWGGCVMARSASAISLSSIVLLILLAPAQGRSLIETSVVMPITEASPTLSPFQHVRFCLRYPADCKSDPTETTTVELTAETLETMQRVNRDVNASIMPVAKSNAIADGGWTISPASGDCNDYAVTKRHELVQKRLSGKSGAVSRCEDPIRHRPPRSGCLHEQGQSGARQSLRDDRALAAHQISVGENTVDQRRPILV